jgi:hypothetical protein
MTRIFPSLAIMAALFLLAAQPASAGTIHTVVPAKIDPNATYLIYIHGARPESFPLSKPHPQRGPFEYQKILEAFATSGLEVIAELRTEKTNPRRFARTRVLEQVKALRAAGVPAHRITVADFFQGRADLADRRGPSQGTEAEHRQHGRLRQGSVPPRL